jgi:hypothetical protein
MQRHFDPSGFQEPTLLARPAEVIEWRSKLGTPSLCARGPVGIPLAKASGASAGSLRERAAAKPLAPPIGMRGLDPRGVATDASQTYRYWR